MRIVALYHPKSDHAGRVEDYAHEYHRFRPSREIELLSLDTKEGWTTASLYEVVRYPAILVLTDTGELQQLWQDQQLPLMNEIDSYMVATESDYTKKDGSTLNSSFTQGR
jgi:hypothetical protein